MQHQHSPGDWHLRYSHTMNWVECVASNDFVVASFDPKEHGPHEEGNMRLVAATLHFDRALRDIAALVMTQRAGAAPREVLLCRKILDIVKAADSAVDRPIEVPDRDGPPESSPVIEIPAFLPAA